MEETGKMQLNFFEYPLKKKIVNVSTVPHRSPFRYPGGKTWFVPFFRQWMKSKKQKPALLIEPFAGGGIIGLTAAFEDLADQILLVEKDENVASVWKVLLEKNHQKLVDEILNFELTLKNVTKTLKLKPKSVYQKALQTIVRNRVSYGGIMAHGSGLTKNGENGRGLSSRWYPATLSKRITDIAYIKNKLSFVQGCGLEIIKKYNHTKENCFFIDPPYTAFGKQAGKRLYKYHNIDHKYLFKLFCSSPADFLFTYDINKDMLNMAKYFNFQTAIVPMKNTHNKKMKELIIGKNLSWLSSK